MVDYTILYALGLVAAVICLTLLSKYLREKNIIKHEDLIVASNILGISVQILDQMNLKNKKEIKTITDIVQITTSYITESVAAVSKETAIIYALDLCEQFNLDITDERRMLLIQIIDIAMKNIKDEKQ